MTAPRDSRAGAGRMTWANANLRALLRALRTHLGWICFATGALLCALGWYGVSGERFSARQIPYLASATAPGIALLVGGLVLLAVRRGSAEPDRERERMRRQIAVLYELLTETDEARAASPPTTAAEVGAGAGTGPAELLSVPGGGLYHRADCLLVQGRTNAERVTPGTAAARGLRPCPLCDPPEV